MIKSVFMEGFVESIIVVGLKRMDKVSYGSVI